MAFAGFALADEIVATGVDWNRGEGLYLSLNNPASTPGATPVPTSVYYAGVITINVTDYTGTYGRDSMCVDLFTDIYLGQLYFTSILAPWMVTNRDLPQVSWLVDNALLPTQSNYVSVLPQSDWATTQAQGAGLQLALWDLTVDGGDGPNAGNVQASPGTPATSTSSGTPATEAGALSWWNTYETLLEAAAPNNISFDAYVYKNTSLGSGLPAQMLEGPMFQTGPGQVPEPATLVLAGSALIGMGLSARRRLARKSLSSRG